MEAPVLLPETPSPVRRTPDDLRRSLDDPSFKDHFRGEISTDLGTRRLYATDASSYREMPLAVACPRDALDIKHLIGWAGRHGVGLIPRAAGTSLAGQVVGKGLVVDVSRHMTAILSIDPAKRRARVQPGVVRDELNRMLRPHGLFFGPETSTANRANLGGMVGNNSCGSNSIVYGSTREHVRSLTLLLDDGSEAVFGPMGASDFDEVSSGRNSNDNGDGVNARITALYREIRDLLADPQDREEIRNRFPKSSIPRRNTGYALDMLIDSEPFGGSAPFNFSKLLCGSEGTLGIVTEIELELVPTPPPHCALVCVHFNSVDEALRANLIALRFKPSACELMDHYVLECTKENISQARNRFFIQEEPKAILVVEIARDDAEFVERDCAALEAAMRAEGLGTHFPVVRGSDTARVWALRKAGLGSLSNIPGDAKPVPVIEDTAVDVRDLPAYIREFNEVLKRYDLYCVHYAHAGSGELHLRPIIDLKTAEGHALFRQIAEEVAELVSRYRGSLSGEHGDGRLRGEFLERMVGPTCFAMMRAVKRSWDPQNRFNPGKIIDTPPMDSSLRYAAGQTTPGYDTTLDFAERGGLLRAVEFCNGSGDCRKSAQAGGTMCPSFQATGRERDSTRARANTMRELLSPADLLPDAGPGPSNDNPFTDEALHDILDRCLSCKGCRSECPSNVDLARLKAEVLHQRHRASGIPWRNRLIGATDRMNAMASRIPGIYNAFIGGLGGAVLKRLLGFAPERTLPRSGGPSLRRWFVRHQEENFGVRSGAAHGEVWLFVDSFTNYLDQEVGQAAIRLLTRLGYRVRLAENVESGRIAISKGLLDRARACAERNVRQLSALVGSESPLIGLEPSALLSLRDEYHDLVRTEYRGASRDLARHTLLLEEFLLKEAEAGRIGFADFDENPRSILVHGHCHQKALAEPGIGALILGLPAGHRVSEIPSGCCGMAGSFGYEARHYSLSMQVGELVLFPALREASEDTLIAAAGTSCRHQIRDGTGRKALHPAEILWEAVRK